MQQAWLYLQVDIEGSQAFYICLGALLGDAQSLAARAGGCNRGW